jgi:hypothetical protein
MLRQILVALTLLVLFSGSSASAQKRDVFDWPWGMSCAQIERQYGKGESSRFNNRREVISYKFHLLNLILEVRYFCYGRGLIWGDGELSSITIGGDYSDIDKDKIYPYCKNVSKFLESKYGRIKSKSVSKDSISFFYEAERINTKAHLHCQDKWNSEFMTVDLTRLDAVPY